MRLAYDGPEGEPFDVPDARLSGVFSPRKGEARDLDALVRRALEEPAGAEPLRELARGRRSVLLLVDDATRATPVRDILPHVARELEAGGVEDARVRVMVATGTHRAMTPEELARKLGPFLGRWRVLQHDYQDRARLRGYGETSGGMPVLATRALDESDLRVGIGHVGVHGIMGYSGGAKIVLPGVCGPETEAWTHWRAGADFEPGALLGRKEGPLRREIEEGARLAGLDAVLNVALAPGGGAQRVAYGDLVRAQRACADAAEELCAVDVPHADVVVVDASPATRDFWQSVKGLYAATLVAREGGVIVLVAPNPEGVARNHPNVTTLAGLPSEEIRRRRLAGELDDEIGAGVALLAARIRERTPVILVSSGVTPNESRLLGFTPAATPQRALDLALAQVGADAEVVVLREGGSIFPVAPGAGRGAAREVPGVGFEPTNP